MMLERRFGGQESGPERNADLDLLMQPHGLVHPPTMPIREAIDFTMPQYGSRAMIRNYLSALQDHEDIPPSSEGSSLSELKEAQELLALLGDPRVRVSSTNPIRKRAPSDPAGEPSIGKRYQVA